MAETMLALGDFRFSLPTAAYDEFRRASEWDWAEQQRFGNTPALQFTGRTSDTITLSGLIYPEFRGGYGQVAAMRTTADAKAPQMLVDGTGEVMGRWVIARVEEGRRVFWPNGQPRRMEFSLTLKKYDDA
jgi:phage protein U